MRNQSTKKNTLMLVLAVIVVLTVAFSAIAMAADSKTITAEEIDGILNTTTDASQVESPFTKVADAVRTSVVGINNYQIVSNSNYYNYYGFGFGYGRDRGDNSATERLYATGSGVAVTTYGHVLTNYHVVEGASRLTVTVEGSDDEYQATLVAYDEKADVAVLLVNDLPVAPVTLGDSDQLQVGEWAIVIGNPLSEAFARTVTVGIVSALDREVTDTAYDAYGRRTNITNQMIQVDAAINSGNSGGGMFNTLGQLMGIPARKYSSSGFGSASVENIGMCIPINVAKPVIREALEKYSGASVTTASANAPANGNRPMLGVTVFTLSGTSGILPNGAIVRSVNEDSNAQRGGIQVGDVIVEVNGTKVTSSTDLVNLVQSYNEGDVLSVKVYRAEGMAAAVTADSIDLTTVSQDGEYIDLTVTLLGNSAT
ncbi:MAG: trypsin-like peptidase domain-containing protein [Clostridia bacterium]|nr:trypsin-like peptidase domain-containing protein [Clostridia bacterium]